MVAIADLRTFLTQSFFTVVLQKSIPTQIRQLILYIRIGCRICGGVNFCKTALKTPCMRQERLDSFVAALDDGPTESLPPPPSRLNGKRGLGRRGERDNRLRALRAREREREVDLTAAVIIFRLNGRRARNLLSLSRQPLSLALLSRRPATFESPDRVYRGTSLIRNAHPLGPP